MSVFHLRHRHADAASHASQADVRQHETRPPASHHPNLPPPTSPPTIFDAAAELLDNVRTYIMPAHPAEADYLQLDYYTPNAQMQRATRSRERLWLACHLGSDQCHLLAGAAKLPAHEMDSDELRGCLQATDNSLAACICICHRLDADGRWYKSLPLLSRDIAAVRAYDLEKRDIIRQHIADTTLLTPPVIMSYETCDQLVQFAVSPGNTLTSMLQLLTELDGDGNDYATDEALLQAVRRELKLDT